MPLTDPECNGKYGPNGPTQRNQKVVIPKQRVLAPESPYCPLKASQPSPQPHKFTELPLPDNLQSTRVMELMPVDPPSCAPPRPRLSLDFMKVGAGAGGSRTPSSCHGRGTGLGAVNRTGSPAHHYPVCTQRTARFCGCEVTSVLRCEHLQLLCSGKAEFVEWVRAGDSKGALPPQQPLL